MKVKGIERARSNSEFGVRSSESTPTQTAKSTARNRIIVIVLAVVSIALAQSATPRPASALSDEAKQSSESLTRDAKKALRKGKFEEAAQLYSDLLKLNENDLQAKLGVSFAYLKLQNYQGCFTLASEAIKSDPKNSRAHALAGLALLRSGHLQAALDELRQSLALNNKDALAIGGIGEIDYYEGRTKEARMRSLQAHNLDPNEPDYLVTYARASSRAEDFKEAADAYELFLQIAPVADKERRDRIQGLIRFYRQLTGIRVHQLYGPDVTEIPFQLGADRRPYMRLKINGREATFVIDTGSGFTVVSKEAAKRLGVSQLARGGTSQGVGGDGKFPIVYGLIQTIQMGETKVRMVPCFIRPFHGTEERPDGERADGLIGLSVLSHFLTELDYKGERLRLDRNVERPMFARADLTSITIVPFRTTQNGLISIETELDRSHTINAILDSAASSTVISIAAVERLNLHDRIIKGQRANVIGAAGIASNVELLFIKNCRVANLQQDNLRALILDFNAINETSGFEQSGILGGDFLRHFRVTIDFTRAQVAFQPHTSAVTRQ